MVKAVVFDLDDTLISEKEYIKSGYRHIAGIIEDRFAMDKNQVFDDLISLFKLSPLNVFNRLYDKYQIEYTKEMILDLVKEYRGHLPDIQFYNDVIPCLSELKKFGVKIGIITDGYVNAQRQKMRAVKAYDYFTMLMNKIKPLNDSAKRNRIIETLVMAAHSVRLDGMNEADYFNYTSHFNTIIELSGDQLIEWAFKKFVDITGIVKTHSAIDYSNKIVLATKEYLEAHYAEDVSLEDVAEHVNISPQYFSKLIKKNTGFNFIDWLSMLRVKKAKELLTNSNLTVKEVCFMVGYKDPNYFSRIFKKKIGMTPSEYVKNKTKISS